MKLIIPVEKYWEMTALRTICGHFPKKIQKKKRALTMKNVSHREVSFSEI